MAVEHDARLRELFEASVAITSELSLDALLQRFVETAARLTGAAYAALGVIDESGTALERFITTGIDEATHAEIGDLPRGRGLLGALIRDAKPLRLTRISDDPRSVGFPPHHPPMTSFLGVPVMLRGVAFGNLYLTEKEGGGAFTGDDEDLAVLLASQAAVAIENARLYETATRWSRQLETLHETVREIVDETDVTRLLARVCARLRDLTHARAAIAALVTPDGEHLRVTAGDGDAAAEVVGHLLDRRHSKMGRVLDRRQSTRVDSLIDDPDVDQSEARVLAARTGLYVPLVVRDRALGVLAVHDKETAAGGRFTDSDQRLAEIFGSRAAVAVALSERVARDTVRRVVAAQEDERRRLALELHDETGQALTSILLGLKSIGTASTAEEAQQAEADVRALVVQALQDVRALAVELRPSALDDFGLAPALERLGHTFAERSGIDTTVQAGVPGRLSAEVETTLYRVVQEALSNVVKHAGATRVSIVLAQREGGVVATVDDDGRGFDEADVREDALGLLGMRERLALVGGTLTVESSPGGGTTVAAQVPAAA